MSDDPRYPDVPGSVAGSPTSSAAAGAMITIPEEYKRTLPERIQKFYRAVCDARAEYGVPEGFSIMDAVFADVAAERARQDIKWGRTWGGWEDPNGLKLAVLLEEVGEVARALLEAPSVVSMPDSDQLRDELIQVAAVAVAWCEMLPRSKRT